MPNVELTTREAFILYEYCVQAEKDGVSDKYYYDHDKIKDKLRDLIK